MMASSKLEVQRAFCELAAKADPTVNGTLQKYLDGELSRYPKHVGVRLPDHLRVILRKAARAVRRANERELEHRMTLTIAHAVHQMGGAKDQ
jgi:hypothetical protein